MTTHNTIERFYDHLDEVIAHNFDKEIAIEGKITDHMGNYNCYVVSYEKYVVCCRYVGNPEYDKGDRVRITGKFAIHPDTGRIIIDINIIVGVKDDVQFDDLIKHYKSVETHLSNKLSKMKFKKTLPNCILKIAFIIPESDRMIERIVTDLSLIKADIVIFRLSNNKMAGTFSDMLRYVNKYGFYDLIIFYTSETSFQYLIPLSSEKVLNSFFEIEKEYNRIPIISCFENDTKSILRLLSDYDSKSLNETIKFIGKSQIEYETKLVKLIELAKIRLKERLQNYYQKLQRQEKTITRLTGHVFISQKESLLMKMALKNILHTLMNKLEKADIIIKKLI